MAKQSKNQPEAEAPRSGGILPTNIVTEMKESYLSVDKNDSKK